MHKHLCIVFTAVLLENKRSSIRTQVDMLVAELQAVDDVHILDHALTTLTQLTTTLPANHLANVKEQHEPATFVPVVKISLAEKSETKFCFHRTTNSAGRKQKMVPAFNHSNFYFISA